MIPFHSSLLIEGFSIKSAAPLNSDGTVSDTKFFGVRSGEIKADIETWEDKSMDRVIDTWSEVQSIDITLEMGYLPLGVLQKVAGEPSLTTTTLGHIAHEMELFSDSWGRQAPSAIRLEVPARDHLGNSRTLYYVLYKVKFLEFDFMSPKFKQGTSVTMKGKSLISSTDELGIELETPSYGRLIAVGEL